MKIAMITPWAVRCGIYTYSEKLAYALAKQNDPGSEEDVEVKIVRLPRFGNKYPITVEKVARSVPIDANVIHVQHEYGLYKNLEQSFYIALKGLKKPIVTTMHAIGNFMTDAMIADLSDEIIVHNEFCKKRLQQPCRIIPHGCAPTETMDKEKAKKALAIPPNVPIVGYMGYISTIKGLETLIEAMRTIKVGVLIGGGWHIAEDTQYIDMLKEKTTEILKGRCQWLGFVPDEEVPMTYGAMDIVVYPSRIATESGALLNAISHGKAVIASKIRPFMEKEVQGALWTFSSVRSLRTKIRRLLKEEKLRASLEEGARAYANANSWDNVAEQHLKLYNDLVFKDGDHES